MKVIALFFCSLLLNGLLAQDISGSWKGEVAVGAMKMALVFHLQQTDTAYTATMEIPQQGARDIPAKIVFEPPRLQIDVTQIGLSYSGAYISDSAVFQGKLSQRGMTFDLLLERGTVVYERPQTPQPPFPYTSEEVFFQNDKAGITLAGTLTLPDTGGQPCPAVVLVSGSGAQNRNSEIMGHQPFYVLADYLSRRGIAVLRYDDRGTAASEGDFTSATTLDFSMDAEAAFDYLLGRPEVDTNLVGMAGHSEGGAIVPIVAAHKDTQMGFAILLAAPGMQGSDLMLLQKAEVEKAMGIPEIMVNHGQTIFKGAYELVNTHHHGDSLLLADSLRQYFQAKYGPMLPANQLDNLVVQLTSPWMRGFLLHDPAPFLQKMRCPVLALNGGKDLQVPASVNLETIAAALQMTKPPVPITIKAFPDLNHLFQHCQTGLPQEYSEITETFAPEVMALMAEWILDL